MSFLQGENKIDIIGNMPGAHFDYLSVSKTADTAITAPSITFQAENMEITDPAAASTDHSGYTGDGFVAMSTGGIKFTINSNEAGNRKLWLRYAYGLTDGPSQITVTSSAGTTQKIPIINESGGGFWDYWYISEPVTVKLAAGENTIEIKALDGDKGSFNVDYVALDSATAAFDGLTVTNVKVDGKTEANITSYTQSVALTYTANQEVNQILYAFGPDDETADSFDDWTGAAQAANNALTELPKTAGTYRLHLKFVSGDQEVVDHSIRVTVTESENPEPGFAVIQPSAMTPLGEGWQIVDEEGCTGGEIFSAVGSGRTISLKFNSAEEGERTVRIRYANQGGNGNVKVANLATGQQTAFSPMNSEGGTDWKVADVKLVFVEGQNQIELVRVEGGVSIDYVAISDAVDTTKQATMEVIDVGKMDISGMDDKKIQTGTKGWTGAGFTQGFGTTRFTFNSDQKRYPQA